MNQDEIEEGFKLLGLEDKITETYEDVSEFTYKIINKPETEDNLKLTKSNITEFDDA